MYKKFVYKAWLFSCTCYSKNFLTGGFSEWKELKECGDLYEKSDMKFM